MSRKFHCQVAASSHFSRCLLTLILSTDHCDNPSPSSLEAMTKSPISDTEQKFTLFPKLPTELRHKIWKHALPGPRVVPLCINRSLRRRQRPCCVTNALITIRRACHEALDIVHKNYDKYVPVWKSQSELYRRRRRRASFYLHQLRHRYGLHSSVGSIGARTGGLFA
jgi:hypothetical protein